MSVCSPQKFLRTSRLPALSLALWTAAKEAATPAALGGFLVDDALSPPPASLEARTTKEVLHQFVDETLCPSTCCCTSRQRSGRGVLCLTMGNFGS